MSGPAEYGCGPQDGIGPGPDTPGPEALSEGEKAAIAATFRDYLRALYEMRPSLAGGEWGYDVYQYPDGTFAIVPKKHDGGGLAPDDVEAQKLMTAGATHVADVHLHPSESGQAWAGDVDYKTWEKNKSANSGFNGYILNYHGDVFKIEETAPAFIDHYPTLDIGVNASSLNVDPASLPPPNTGSDLEQCKGCHGP